MGRADGKESEMSERADFLKKLYRMERHVEGGFFSEMYTAPFEHERRPLAGSIYYLLDAGEVSRFHQIDCDEIWYFHEGCGMKIIALSETGKQEFLLGGNALEGERASVVIPKGMIFAAENLKNDGFTFVSCITVPKFAQSGYRLVDRSEIEKKYPLYCDELARLAY